MSRLWSWIVHRVPVQDIHDVPASARPAAALTRQPPQSESPLTLVAVQGDRQRRRLGPSLELADPSMLPRLLAMHGVLQPHKKLLEMGDPRLERVDRARILGRWLKPRWRGPSAGLAQLHDPRGKWLASKQTGGRAYGRLSGRRAAGRGRGA
jgi:hypothetical protein